MLKKRTITALLAFFLVIIVIWLDGPIPWFTLFIAAWGSLALIEIYRLTEVTRVHALAVFGVIITLLFILSPDLFPSISPLALLTAAVTLSMVLPLIQPKREGIFVAWGLMLAGTLYIGWLMSFLVRLRLDGGKEWVVLALFATFASDTAAFFIGRAIGRRKLAPRISPNKTWEGTLGGLAGSVIVCWGLDILLGMGLSLAKVVLFGLTVSTLGQLGGLFASLIKRNAGVKDSGSLLPGHGGVLDRTDSVVFAGVTAYAFFWAITSGWLNWL